MMWILSLFLLLPAVFAQFAIKTDKNDYDVSDTMKVSWEPRPDNALNLQSLDVAQILLCTCNTTGKFDCSMLDDSVKVSDKSYSLALSKIGSSYAPGKYTLQFVALNSKDKKEMLIAYLQAWLSFTGFTGTGTAKSSCGIPGGEDHNVPGTGTSSVVWSTSYTLPASLQGVASWDIPYTWQKGPSRMAPFLSTPGTKITVTSTPSRRFPTSSYSPYSTYFFNKFLPVTTRTPGPTSTAHQSKNMVPSLKTTPSGRKPTRVMPTLSLPAETTSSGDKRQRQKRWAD